MQKMRKIDSFLKESQRLDGLGVRTYMFFLVTTTRLIYDKYYLVTMGRLALKDFIFSNGMKVPRGAFLSCASTALHCDEEIYKDPDVFDPFRFSDVRGQGHGEETKHQLVATGVRSSCIGHSRTCGLY